MIWIDEHACLRPEKLLALSFPGTRRNYPRWVPQFIHQCFTKDFQNPRNSRIFVTRKGYRRNPQNLSEVEGLLIRYGFEIYDPMAKPLTHRDFYDAEFVVGASGSNLTGLVFCKPGTKVLELMSEDHVYPYYYSMCDSADLKYSCLPCKCPQKRKDDAWGPSQRDFQVDLVELEEAIVTLLGE